MWKDKDQWLLDRGYKCYHIIDGHQRIVTFLILLSEILRRFDDSEDILSKKKSFYIEKYFYQHFFDVEQSFVLEYTNDSGSDSILKNIAFSADKNRYYKKIKGNPSKDNMVNASEFFAKHIRKISKEDLEVLFCNITNKSKFILFELDNSIESSNVFKKNKNKLYT